MATIIAKKIKAKIKTAAENSARSSYLVNYVTTEHVEEKTKCTAKASIGFSKPNLSNEDMISEIREDMDLPKLRIGEMTAHWIISWKGEDQPDDEEAIQGAMEHMAALGYTEDYKQLYAVHRNTEHVHVHIATCRVNQWSGRLLNEGNGWYKLESQKALVKIAQTHDWELEPGHRFKRERKNKPKKSQKAVAMEIQTGEISEQTKLQVLLKHFLEKHEEDFPNWKFADYHKALAQLGIECKRVEITKGKGGYGILFSMDSKIWCKATSVCPNLTYTKILEKIKAKSWRDAREEIKELLKEKRIAITERLKSLIPEKRHPIVIKHAKKQNSKITSGMTSGNSIYTRISEKQRLKNKLISLIKRNDKLAKAYKNKKIDPTKITDMELKEIIDYYENSPDTKPKPVSTLKAYNPNPTFRPMSHDKLYKLRNPFTVCKAFTQKSQTKKSIKKKFKP